MMIFIDIGNTRIKYTTAQQPFDVQYAAHDDLSPLFEWFTQQSPQKLLIANGRSQSAQASLLAIRCFAETDNTPVHFATVRPELLTINYADPKQLGIDRFLHLLAGRARCLSDFCVVSCGTAVTLDFYTDKHIGGMILPGVGSAKQLLAEKTGLTEIRQPDDFLGNDTASSIGAGIYHGYQQLIYGSIHQVSRDKNTHFSILLTGGDAADCYQAGEIIDTLLFEGLHHYHQLIQQGIS